jgi:hypothetical protein
MSNTYHILKNAIGAGGYKLADMQGKIKKYHIVGDITEEQEKELLSLALSGASPAGERPSDAELLQAMARRIEALETRVKVLEDGENAEAGEGTGEGEIEPWAPWDGLSNKYQPSAIVSHGGKVWESTYDGQNVWEPGAVGIDERFWRVRDETGEGQATA